MTRFNALERTAGALALLALGCWAQPAAAQNPTCMWGQGDVLCRSSRAAADIDGWLRGEIARRDREPARGGGGRRPWYESETMPEQERLARELRGMGLLEPGWNDRPASVEVGEAVAGAMRRMDALAPACRAGSAPACAELRRLEGTEAARGRAVQRAVGVMAAENERLERSNRTRSAELAERHRTQAIELRGQADRYDALAEGSFRRDDFAAGRYHRERAAELREQADGLDPR